MSKMAQTPVPTRTKARRTLSRREFTQGVAIGAAGLLGGCATSRPVKSADQDPSAKQNSVSLSQFIAGMPKAELHVHLEGTVEPAVAMKIAARNGLPLPYATVEAYEAALNFNSLASFLEAFHKTIDVLKTEQDFYEIAYAYLAKCHSQNIVYADLKFDPQAHQRRGIVFAEFFNGIRQAQTDAQHEFGVSSQLIMCFQRDASLESAEKAFAEAKKYPEHIIAVGLDNTEVLTRPQPLTPLIQQNGSTSVRSVGRSSR